MGIFDKLKKAMSGQPVTGVAIISDVEEVQQMLEDIVDEVLAEEEE
jgi:hypothetical protein